MFCWRLHPRGALNFKYLSDAIRVTDENVLRLRGWSSPFMWQRCVFKMMLRSGGLNILFFFFFLGQNAQLVPRLGFMSQTFSNLSEGCSLPIILYRIKSLVTLSILALRRNVLHTRRTDVQMYWNVMFSFSPPFWKLIENEILADTEQQNSWKAKFLKKGLFIIYVCFCFVLFYFTHLK